MKNLLLSLGLALMPAVIVSAAAPAAHCPDIDSYMSGLCNRRVDTGRHWRKGAEASKKNTPLKVVTEATDKIGPMSYWGQLNTPQGEEWMYSAEYHEKAVNDYDTTIESADLTIYDSDFNVKARFTAEFTLAEGETSINTVQISPCLTRKFFNLNEAYEVMVFVHATTEDYSGHIYTQVYTLSDGSLIDTLEGYSIAEVNLARDAWSEQYVMAFMRESTEYTEESFDYRLAFDIYSRAGWGTGCILDHTFDVDYTLVAGAGNYALPILMNRCGDDLYFALPHYAKPFFKEGWSEEATPDNSFVVELYDSSYNLVKTTSIPMTTEGDALFSFPGMGELYGFGDLSFGVYSDSDVPMYVIGVENYIASTDEFSTSMYVYDTDGNRVKTLFENADDYLALSDVRGYEPQYCIYKAADDGGKFEMVDIISGQVSAEIPIALDDSGITTSIDRVPVAGSYSYFTSMSTGLADEDDNILHRVAWFDADGKFDRFDVINMGQGIVMAQVNIAAEVMDPYLFNTDDNYEYMLLVKKRVDEFSSRTSEYLRIYSDNELLLELGPDTETGEILNSIFLINPDKAQARLVVGYYDGKAYTLRHLPLPLYCFAGGQGTETSPYIITTPGDVHAMRTAPNAYYELGCDIDFGGREWQGNDCCFNGSLNGMGNTMRNLRINGTGLFASMGEKAVVTDLNIDGVDMTAHGTSGVLAGEISGGDANKGAAISGVNINNAHITAEGDAQFGTIAGYVNLHASVTGCNVTGLYIDMDDDDCAGGIAGRISTFGSIDACVVDGRIRAGLAAGIVGESIHGSETITNCHTNADIEGVHVAGGVIGESSRSSVTNCLVDGSVSATGIRMAYAGGIAGSLKATYDDVKSMVIENCLVTSAVSANTAAGESVAHRIVGMNSGDEKLVDWDSKDPSVNWEDPSTYPYVNGDPEKALAGNYALGVARIDENTADDDTTPEGKTITLDELTDEFLAAHKWVVGTTAQEPWRRGGYALVLYSEDLSLSIAQDVVVVSPADSQEAPVAVAITCAGRYASLIKVGIDNSAVAEILDAEVTDDGRTLVCRLIYKGEGECTLTAMLDAEQASCVVKGTLDSISDVSTDRQNMVFDGVSVVMPESEIAVYNVSGMLVATGHGSVDVSTLLKGIYIAVSGDEVLKFTKR